MEVSTLRYSGGIGLHGRSPLLRLQSDERLIAMIRRGNSSAFEVLVSRYHSRLLAFCRHLLGSKEDAEDVLQEVFAAAFNAMLADERPINVRPWLYRIARNRSLNHLRRIQAIGVDSMDVHFSEFGATTADKVHDREQFRLLIRDIQTLPETQRTALVLRELDALSYEQIAEAMDTTVPGVKSLLVRARISLAEAAEARQLSCDEVRIELAEVAEGLRKRPPTLVRRHLRTCNRCATFQTQLKQTNKALAALIPIGPLALLRKLLIVHLGHSAGTGSTAGAAGATGASTGAGAGGLAAGPAAAVAGTAGSGAAFGSAGSLLSAGTAAIATKAAAGLAAAAIVTAGAVEASHTPRRSQHPAPAARLAAVPATGGVAPSTTRSLDPLHGSAALHRQGEAKQPAHKPAAKSAVLVASTASSTPASTTAQHPSADTTTNTTPGQASKPTTGQTTVQSDPTVLSSSGTSGSGQATDSTATGGSTTATGSAGSGTAGSGSTSPSSGGSVSSASASGGTVSGGSGSTGTGCSSGGGTSGSGTGSSSSTSSSATTASPTSQGPSTGSTSPGSTGQPPASTNCPPPPATPAS